MKCKPSPARHARRLDLESSAKVSPNSSRFRGHESQFDRPGYETFGNGTAETLTWLLSGEELPANGIARFLPRLEKSPGPARDNLNYNETAALAALDYTATNSRAFPPQFL